MAIRVERSFLVFFLFCYGIFGTVMGLYDGINNSFSNNESNIVLGISLVLILYGFLHFKKEGWVKFVSFFIGSFVVLLFFIIIGLFLELINKLK